MHALKDPMLACLSAKLRLFSVCVLLMPDCIL